MLWIRAGALAALLAGCTAAHGGARHTDIAAFRTEFLARDRSYSPAARAAAETRLAALGRTGCASAPGLFLP